MLRISLLGLRRSGGFKVVKNVFDRHCVAIAWAALAFSASHLWLLSRVSLVLARSSTPAGTLPGNVPSPASPASHSRHRSPHRSGCDIAAVPGRCGHCTPSSRVRCLTSFGSGRWLSRLRALRGTGAASASRHIIFGLCRAPMLCSARLRRVQDLPPALTSGLQSSLLFVRHGYDIRSPLVPWWRGRSGVQIRRQAACDIRRACCRRGWNADMRSRCTRIRDSLISCYADTDGIPAAALHQQDTVAMA